MADNRKIIHGVVVDGKTITDVDELAEVLTPEMQTRLETAGSIEGDWKAKGKAKGKAADKSDAKTDAKEQ